MVQSVISGFLVVEVYNYQVIASVLFCWSPFKQAHLRLLMTECRFENEETANIVLQLLEEVEGNGDAEYPLQYYIDAAKDHKDLESARSFLIKECEICIMAQTIHEVGIVC